jgi:alpha-L-fucosidase
MIPSHPLISIFGLTSLLACSFAAMAADNPTKGFEEENPNLSGGTKTQMIPPEPRLQIDLSGNNSDLDWWRESLKNRDARLDWWRDARFGCFIHWNASSLLAGEWQGEIYPGYAEHIQRMAKIPCPVYRKEVVGQFNPTKFDADAWVRLIKAAGMRYLVITAKHHDGFAMWDSEASDFNIVDATPFKRDPIRELKEACDRHGIPFGVYYSHAFDWGEPNAPGNDWDYENPGGNRGLFGGLQWFDQHPEIVPRMRTYVDDKSIPQIVELLENYDPALIWFDTASKLPPEENLRILKAVREAKPDIVVNSRIVFPYAGWPGPFGDYLSTGDRAVEFRPFEGDWETIPTTNESYGYHKHDPTHKTPDYLIEVIAKAVAKGGNILLNVGPMGDGRIDPIDVNILEGIGQWMETYETSIRPAGKTTLTVQPWGQSTLHGNRLYLHVFEWPADEKIQVGGLRTEITQAQMMGDAARMALPHRRLDNRTVEIELAGEPPKIGHAVVVMDVADATAVDPHRLLSPLQPNQLLGFDAQILGDGYKFGDGKARRDYIAGWNGKDQKLVWEVYLREPASYELAIEYQRIGEPGAFVVTCGEATFQATTKGKEVDQWFSDYITHDLGRLELPAGSHRIEFAPVGKPDGELLRFRALHLKPN